MTRLLPTLLMLVALAACAGRGAPPDQADVDSSAQLRADLFQPEAGSLRFSLTRPAYVAVFEVVPFRGVRMLSPATESGGWHHAGLNVEPVLPAVLGPESYWGGGGGGMRSRTTPHYFFLVASLRPLGTEQFVRSPSALYKAIGSDEYTNRDPHVAMQSIVDNVFHLPSDDSWVSASYETGPEVF